MVKTHTQNVLALSVAALVASGVAAFAGVATFNDDLMGKSVYLAQEGCPGGCPMGQWCDYVTHSCKADNYPSDGIYPSGDSSSISTTGAIPTTTGTTSGPTGLNCAGGALTACQATCTKDGVVNTFCTGYCAQECPSTSTTTTATSTTVDRCAMYSLNECEALCSCAKDKFSAVNNVEKAALWYTDLWPSGGKTYGGCVDECLAKKNATPPAPITEPEPPVLVPMPESAPVPFVEEEHMAAPAFDDFSDDGFGGGYGGDFDDFGGDGDYDDYDEFGGPDDFGFGPPRGFDPGFGPPMDDFGFFEDEFGYMPEGGDFEDYFMGYGPPMGMEFGGGFGDGFGEMPFWMEEELERIKDEMLGEAERFCPDVVEQIDDVESFEDLEDIGRAMREECMGGGFGGPMDDPSEAVEMLQEMVPAIRDGLVILLENGFDAERGEKINSLLDEVEEAAENAEEVCAGIGFGGDDDEDFFGMKGFLAQFIDDEGMGDPGECRMAIEEAAAFMDDPEDPESDATVRGNMESPTEKFFRSLDKEKGTKSAISVCEEFIDAMEEVVGGGDDSGETPEDMCKEMAGNDWDIPDDGGPGGEDFEGGEFEGEGEGDEDFGEFEEGEEDEENLEDFEF